MLEIGTQVKIKSLDQLLKEKLLVKEGDIFVTIGAGNVYKIGEDLIND